MATKAERRAIREKFNPQAAQAHLDKLLQQHGITVEKYSTSSCGYAYWDKPVIKIPHPTDTDRFCVAMHEIKHVIDGNVGYRFEQEFACDMFAREQALLLGFDVTDWDRRTNWHSLSRIAMATNRGLHPDKISPAIRAWFCDVSFVRWNNNKVFVSYEKKTKRGYKVRMR